MVIFIFLVLGFLSGILIHRAADNLPPPARRSFLETPRCPYCGTPRSLLEQSGVPSFVLRRDRCHQCGAPMKLRTPLVEIGTAALFAFLANRFPFDAYLVALCFFTAVLVLITVIDIEHKRILNVVTYPSTALALVLSPIVLGGTGFSIDSIQFNLILFSMLGAVVGYGVTLAIYYFGVLFLRIVNRGRTQKINTVAFGMGDVKLAGLLGALVGFPAIIFVLVYAILLGGVGAFIAILFRVVTRRGYSAFMAIPYGPYLVLAGAAFLFQIWHP